MVKRFVAELLRKQILCAGSELSTRVLRKVLSPTLFPIYVAFLFTSRCIEHHRRRIGISLAIFSSSVFSHLGSPKVSVLNGWNKGRGKRGTFTLFKETLASAQAAGHGEQMRTVLATKTVPRFAVLSVPSSDDCGSHRPRCHVPRLGHQLNPRGRNTCPIVQILHCLDPFSMC